MLFLSNEYNLIDNTHLICEREFGFVPYKIHSLGMMKNLSMTKFQTKN